MPKTLRALFPRRVRKKRVAVLVVLITAFWWIIQVGLFADPKRPAWADTAVTSKERADAVKEVFDFAWEGYYKHAFPNDELHPLWNLYGNSRNGWGASAVEALGTAIIMDKQEVVDQIMNFIPTIDFQKTKSTVDLFETTIRYIGGMLSAYDLLKGPAQQLAHDDKAVESLLMQSRILADRLKFAFDTPSGMPWKTLLLEKQKSDGNILNSAVAVGSLIIEWTRLAHLTGDMEYRSLVDKAMKPLLNPQPDFNEAIPGIVGNWVNVQSGEFTDAWGSWGPGGDSFYEYLIKMYAYDQTRYGLNKDRWTKAAESAMTFMAVSPPGTNFRIISQTDAIEVSYESSHLECFAGGNFILAAKVLNDTRYLNFGLQVTEGCHELYIRTKTRIGPETVIWPPHKMTAKQSAQAEKLGFAIVNPSFQLRPETMESYYYAYRATKDPKYREWAWDAFVAIVTHTKVRHGFTPISNVDKIGLGWKPARQESFFFSELLKYAYLIFAEEAEYQFNFEGENKWVFNTEGHPLKVARPW